MGNRALIPHYLNIGISLVVTASMFWLLRKADSPRRDQLLTKLHCEPSVLRIDFVRAALYLWAVRSLGHVLVHAYLSWMVAQHHDPLDWSSDPTLILLADLFTVVSVWTWLTVLRGPAHVNLPKTFVEIFALCTILVPMDLLLSGHRRWMLVPSLVLNVVSAVLAIAAAYFRYREHSYSFMVGFTCYNLLQIPAFDAAWYGNPEPARWIYYALASGKLFNLLLICDLLLSDQKRKEGMPVLSFLKTVGRYIPIAALLALAVVIVESQRPWLKEQPLFLTVTFLVPGAIVVVDFLKKLGKRKLTIPLTEDEYFLIKSKAKKLGISMEDFIRRSLFDDSDKSQVA